MSVRGRKEFLEAVSENQSLVQYVKLFRMPLFLTVLDDELKKVDESVWESESAVRENAFSIMPFTLHQFSVPEAEVENVINQCVAGYLKK